MARSPRGVSSSDDLQGFSDTWRAYLAKTSSFWMHGGDILPRTGVFLVRGPFGNASEHNLAIARHRGTHFASILPLPNSRKRVEDMCAYPNASVDAATVDEPEGDGGVGAPSVERGNRRPQACAATGRDGGGCTLRQGRGRLRAFAASGAGRRLRARPRDGAVGGGQHQLRGQLRHEGANEPVHSNIFPLRYSYQNYLLCNK